MTLQAVDSDNCVKLDVKKVTLLGVTGTIGENASSIICAEPEKYNVFAVTANENVSCLVERAKTLKATHAVIRNDALYSELKEALHGSGIEAHAGEDALHMVASESVDVTLSGIVGSAALSPTLAAIKAGNRIALANKECLVMAGALFKQAAKESGATILPVDSEHNALFQLLEKITADDVKTLTLTASGGPFRALSKEALEHVTLKEALKHPNWEMGPKITIDSATMMNKGLEVIEAAHLFPFATDQFDVLVHPESVIHALITLTDGSQMAHLSRPDMRLPIAHALHWPKRVPTDVPGLSLAEQRALTFELPDMERFPCLKLALDALKAGGSAPAILNAANEVAVEAFLTEKIRFIDIAKIVDHVLQETKMETLSTLEQAVNVDMLARETARNYI